MTSTAIITGIKGQDGSYLAELLLSKGYQVHGVVRPSHTNKQPLHSQNSGLSATEQTIPRPVDHHRFFIHEVDLLDQASVRNLLLDTRPSEYYHLAAMSCVPRSWDDPVGCAETNAIVTLHALEAIRTIDPTIRFLQAGSAEMFGKPIASPQCELTPFRPRNPYASSKVMSHHLTCNYREHYRLFACNAILFNHESPRRPNEFVSRKITQSAARIKFNLQNELRLGNVEAMRDWGYAGDYVEAMWRILQHDKADDFVIGTGQSHKVSDIVNLAFNFVGLDPAKYVVIDPAFSRPEHGCQLVADSSKARKQLDWQPQVTFPELITMMIKSDLALIEQQLNQPNSTADRFVA